MFSAELRSVFFPEAKLGLLCHLGAELFQRAILSSLPPPVVGKGCVEGKGAAGCVSGQMCYRYQPLTEARWPMYGPLVSSGALGFPIGVLHTSVLGLACVVMDGGHEASQLYKLGKEVAIGTSLFAFVNFLQV